MTDKKSCENCEWWKDYEQRVFAIVSGVKGERHPGTIELRLCRYCPPPQAIAGHMWIYTDKDHVCSGWQEVNDDA